MVAAPRMPQYIVVKVSDVSLKEVPAAVWLWIALGGHWRGVYAGA